MPLAVPRAPANFAMPKGMPLSRLSTWPISSAACSMRSASFHNRRARATGGMLGQGPLSNALRAARTARSISSAPPAAAWPRTLPVAGFSTSMRPPARGSTHSLLISNPCLRPRKAWVRAKSGRSAAFMADSSLIVLQTQSRHALIVDVLVVVLAHVLEHFVIRDALVGEGECPGLLQGHGVLDRDLIVQDVGRHQVQA